MSESSTHSLKRLQDTLTASSKELSRLDITYLKEAVAKLVKLLKFAKRIKADGEAVRQLIDHVERLNQTTLEPILEAKPNPLFSISEGLRCSLCTLFNALDATIPEQSQSSRLSLYFSSTDVGSVVLEANLIIDDTLNAFVQHGAITHSGDFHLVQVKLDSREDLESTVLPTGGHVQAQAGPSTSQPEMLSSQVQRALDQCPRFRILLLGKSGAGKSSLINKVFGVSSAEIVKYQAGRAEISQEHTSELNPFFVLHDSMGFESGSKKQHKIVEDFIQERNSQPDLTEKVHAIWLCTATPVSGARVFETGDEQIFKLKLGNVPLIVVFTQYDNMITMAEMKVNPLEPDFEAKVKAKAEERFEELCAAPLRKICTENLKRADPPPFMRVSVKQSYEDTLADLIRLTRELLPAVALKQVSHSMRWQSTPNTKNQKSSSCQHSAAPDMGASSTQEQSAVGITCAIAQRTDPTTKIDAITA